MMGGCKRSQIRTAEPHHVSEAGAGFQSDDLQYLSQLSKTPQTTPELVFTVRLILDYLLDLGSCYSQSRFAIGFREGYRFHNLIHFICVSNP
jgi:hypothetical protein